MSLILKHFASCQIFEKFFLFFYKFFYLSVSFSSSFSLFFFRNVLCPLFFLFVFLLKFPHFRLFQYRLFSSKTFRSSFSSVNSCSLNLLLLPKDAFQAIIQFFRSFNFFNILFSSSISAKCRLPNSSCFLQSF